jgi:hypothetical protein
MAVWRLGRTTDTIVIIVEPKAIQRSLEKTMEKWKRIWNQGRACARDAHVDETVRTLRELVRQGEEELKNPARRRDALIPLSSS